MVLLGQPEKKGLTSPLERGARRLNCFTLSLTEEAFVARFVATWQTLYIHLMRTHSTDKKPKSPTIPVAREKGMQDKFLSFFLSN
jgi:hypothetical protein